MITTVFVLKFRHQSHLRAYETIRGHAVCTTAIHTPSKIPYRWQTAGMRCKFVVTTLEDADSQLKYNRI